MKITRKSLHNHQTTVVADIIKYDITTDLVGQLLFPQTSSVVLSEPFNGGVFSFSAWVKSKNTNLAWNCIFEYIFLALKVKKNIVRLG